MTTTAVLPAAAVGQPTQLRFRTADDSSVAPEGDAGWWIDSIMLGVEAVPPAASFAPASLDFSVDPGATATQSLMLSNGPGSDALSYDIESRSGASHRPTLIPYASLAKASKSSISKALAPRVMARVVPGEATGRDKGSCLVTLVAWRDASMTQARWERLIACHEVEIRLVQALLAQEKAS